jgi:AcrR family transcriptional regulator
VSRPRRPSTDQRIASALRRLAEQRPIDEIQLTELAREAGLSWPTVKRHVGDRQRLRELAEGTGERPGHGKLDARERLLLSAERVFARQGFAAATLDEIAADAGLTKGAVYWHFEGKTDLFVSLFDDRVAGEEPAQHVVGRADARQALYRLLARALGRAQGSRDHARLLLEFASELRVPEVRERVFALLARRDAEAAQALAELQRERLLDPELDPEQAARLLAATTIGLLVLSLADAELDLATFLPEIARMLERGLGAPVRR